MGNLSNTIMAFYLIATLLNLNAIYVLANINFPLSDNQNKDIQQQQQQQQQQQPQQSTMDFNRIKQIRNSKSLPYLKSKIPIELDILIDNNDLLIEKTKRYYDDYGHLRFGKRAGEDQFDDYGHMRFGR